MIETPRNVCFEDGIIQWSAVPYADGYNVHSGIDYVVTVDGGDSTSFAIPEDMPEPYTVSAWVRDNDGMSCHTPRSNVAGGPYMPSGELVVDERFENLDNWLPRFPYWDETINNELQTYVDDAFTFDEDGVTINAVKEDDQWTSGILTGPIEQSYLYGYFEAEIKLPDDQGLWPAFWLLNTKYVGKRPEIDIMEMVGKKLYQSYHWWSPEWAHVNNHVDFIDRFNLFGLDWQPNRLTFYINRMPVFEVYGDHVSDQEMYPIFNLAVGGDWPGDPEPELESAKMTVRSFRVWQ